MTTFGAPAGALTSNRFGIFALRTSKVVLGGMRGSCTGRTVRLTAGCADAAVAQTAARTGVIGNFAIRFMDVLRLRVPSEDRPSEPSRRLSLESTWPCLTASIR